MQLFRRGAAILLMVLIALALSGCVQPAPLKAGQAIPIPIPGNYIGSGAVTSTNIANSTITNVNIAANAINTSQIQNGAVNNSIIAGVAVNDTQLAANAIGINVTVNITGGTILGTALTPLYDNGSITVNRTSLVVVQWSGEIGVNSTNGSFIQIQLGGVNMTSSPMNLTTNDNNSYSIYGTRTVLMYNSSVTAGTYAIVPYVNGSTATALVTFGKDVLITTAYPE